MGVQEYRDRAVSMGIPGLIFAKAGFSLTRPVDMPDRGTWNLPGDLPGYFVLYVSAFDWWKLGGYWELV